jgi:multiple sugar transport system ATP-binding protein
LAKVVLKNISKRFGDVVAVKDVSLEINDGEFLVLLGPSGCGKTTTLRCIAGLENPDEGEIYIGDQLVNNLTPKERNIAMVFQSYALYPHMKVYDNIGFPLKMRKIKKDEIDKRVKQTAELLRITNLLKRKPKELSGGERQRVALGRAIIRDPKVFLMDEPLSNLDAKLRTYMRAELKRLQDDLGVTTIYVTHDQVEAMTMADEVAIMNLGVLEQVGNAFEVYHNPESLFVAGFIGSPPMNFLNCDLKEKDGSFFLDAGSFVLPLMDNLSKMVKENATSSELVIGVRPEDFFLEERRTAKVLIKAKVYITEPLGSEVIVDLKVGDEIVKVKTPPDSKINIGDELWIGFSQDNMHIFDKSTKKAII